MRLGLFDALLWGLRLAVVLLLTSVVWFGYRRFHVDDEAAELARYVEIELPALAPKERDVLMRLRRLSERPGPTPEAARALLVGDVIPRLLKLQAQGRAVSTRAQATRRLRDEYLGWIDALISACRATVRAIDDPTIDGRQAAAMVADKFTAADARVTTWREHLRAACVAHRLQAPAP